MNENYHHGSICTTYDSYLKFTIPFDIVVIDEAHLIAGHGSFRTDTLSGLINDKTKKILLTATPEVIDNLSGYNQLTFDKTPMNKEVTIKQGTASIQSVIEIIQNRNKENLTIIRVNDKNLIDEVYDEYKADTVVKLYSDSDEVLVAGQNNKIVQDVKRGIIPKSVEILLCTSILDAGISLDVKKDVDAHSLASRNMPNAIDMIQLLARVRANSGHVMNLTIVGKFGYENLPDKINIGNQTPRLIVKLLNTVYQTYEELDYEAYAGILNAYGIKVHFDNLNTLNKKKMYSSGLKLNRIVKNFNSFPKLYNQIKQDLESNHREHEIDLITGKGTIQSSPCSRVRRIHEQLRCAIKCGIPFNIFIDDKYHEKRIKNLIVGYDSRSSDSFRIVLCQILDGMYESEYKMNLDDYSTLSEPHQESIKELARLLFKFNTSWNRKSITLRYVHNENMIDYLDKFTYLKSAKSVG